MGVSSLSFFRTGLLLLMLAGPGCDSAGAPTTERRLVYEQMTVSDDGPTSSIRIMGRPFSHPALKRFPHVITVHHSWMSPQLYVDRDGEDVVRLVTYLPNFDRGCNWGWAREIDVKLTKTVNADPAAERQRKDALILCDTLCRMDLLVVSQISVERLPVKLGQKEDWIPKSLRLSWSGVLPGETTQRLYLVDVDFQAESFKIEEQTR
jgi:hypothetical protein